MSQMKKAQSVNESDMNSQLVEQTKNKIENIRQALKKFDKDLDDEINQDELLNFLDSNMRNGQKFDRGLANKIFEALDLDKSGRITVEEFIRNFISIEEEIKTHAKDLQNKYMAEKEKNLNIQKMLLENQTEKLNAEGIGQNAKITIEIYNIEFLRNFSSLKRISIRIRFESEAKETRQVSGEENVVVWKEKFEFRVARKDILYFEVINNDEISGRKEVLGTVSFPLNKIERQDEYDLELEIPDENDENVNMAKINAKIQFIWSIYKYYQDLLTKSERVLQNCQAMLVKTNKLLENLNEPLRFFEAVDQRGEFNFPGNEADMGRGFGDGNNSLGTLRAKSTANTQEDHTKQYEVADKLENFIKNTFNKPNIQWMGLIKLFIITLIILGFLNTFVRSDFINIIVPTMILVIFYTSLNKNVVGYLHMFIIAIAATLGYDLLWFLFSSSSYAGGSGNDGGNENSVRFLVFLSSFISFDIKILLGLSLWIQKLKYERGIEDKNNLLNSPSGNMI